MKTDNSAARVTQHLRSLAAGQAAGARLASVRTLVAELRVSPVTVQRVLDTLVREGVLDTRPGQGTFVAARREPASTPADLGWQSLALGPARAMSGALAALCLMPSDRARPLNVSYLPEELQASSLLAVAAARAMRRPGVWGRMPVEGLPALRAWFADAIPGAFQPHEVTICPGTQAANAAAFRALAAPGEPVLVESPTYVGAIAAALAAGLRLVPVPSDAEGVRPDHLAEAFPGAPAHGCSTASRAMPIRPAPCSPRRVARRCWPAGGGGRRVPDRGRLGARFHAGGAAPGAARAGRARRPCRLCPLGHEMRRPGSAHRRDLRAGRGRRSGCGKCG